MAQGGFAETLRGREEISITVTGRRSGHAITHPVWFVLQGQTLWLLPVHGSRTQWYRNVRVTPTITIRAGRKRLTTSARPVEDPKTVTAVAGWFREKYTPREIARYYTTLDVAVEVSPIT